MWRHPGMAQTLSPVLMKISSQVRVFFMNEPNQRFVGCTLTMRYKDALNEGAPMFAFT